jgi:murein DD-endopeptidase MepM/ murein hydrolase activator NlpD
MEDENKKVNNESSFPEDIQDIYDEIMGSTRKIVDEFSEPELSKEEKMRREAEKKHEEEMAAIKLDIERRYALEIEESKKNIEAAGGNPVEPEAEKVNDIKDLNEIINLEAFKPVDTVKEKKKDKKPKNKKKEIKFVNLDEKNSVYAFLYILGDMVTMFFSSVFGNLISLFLLPFAKLKNSIRASKSDKDKSVKNRLNKLHKESKTFRKEFLSAAKNIFKSFRKPLSLPAVIGHYIAKAFNRHSHLIKTAVNTALPIASLLILLTVLSHWNNVTFALDVIYNDKSIGYISDESVFIEAKEMVMDRLTANNVTAEEPTAASENLNAGYRLALVPLDELNDARTISDKMIENSVDNLTHACGIYIDNDFICAVKNEADAKTVFYNIINPYEIMAEKNGYVVSFLQDIDYVQGLYRDDDQVMWDAAELESFINSNKLVNIKKSVTVSEIKPVKYSTVSRRDITKYSGYREVSQNGVDGVKRVTTTKVYIDDKYNYTTTTEDILVEPFDEILVIGTMTVKDGIYIGNASDQGFLWPAPSCHYVSSPYGWRSSGWHKGIDLCTGNGAARGTPVVASRSGTVEVVQRSNSGYGNMVLINHGDGYKTRYAHLLEGTISVNIGSYVEAGTVIGKVGSTGNSTGPHLHFEVIYNGETQDPKNYIY